MDFGSLDLRHLRLVRAVNEEGSLTAASGRLALSQPALSHQLHDVEGRLGVNLFERRGRSLVLTEAGYRVLAAAHAVLDEIARAEADLAALADGRAGTLRVAAEFYTTYHWLPDVLVAFGRQFPDVQVHVVAEGAEDPARALAERSLDVAVLVTCDGLGPHTSVMPLFSDEVVAIVAEDHSWASRDSVEALDFANEHLIVHRARPELDCTHQLLCEEGVRPARLTALPLATEAVVGMVRAGLGVAPMARWAAEPYLAQGGLATVPITVHGRERQWVAAVRDEPAPPFLDAFVDALRDAEQLRSPSRT